MADLFHQAPITPRRPQRVPKNSRTSAGRAVSSPTVAAADGPGMGISSSAERTQYISTIHMMSAVSITMVVITIHNSSSPANHFAVSRSRSCAKPIPTPLPTSFFTINCLPCLGCMNFDRVGRKTVQYAAERRPFPCWLGKARTVG